MATNNTPLQLVNHKTEKQTELEKLRMEEIQKQEPLTDRKRNHYLQFDKKTTMLQIKPKHSSQKAEKNETQPNNNLSFFSLAYTANKFNNRVKHKFQER